MSDHVDVINHAIQAARLVAGHLDCDDKTSIAGGESAHVGDVIATRRNDRRLVTGRGEPVRNRDTWTVTAINDDGSITATHEAGHGDVTLPADYVGDHVRLGYAATEHGWQSDTVDTAIALTSPATTRRGLYVAATRGSERNIICVVTDSHDLAEARDVLETILATDRADIPATTQRRTLAQSTPRETPTAPRSTPRCEIPDWFQAVLADARRDLLDAQTRDAQRSARRTEAIAAAASADGVLVEVAAATAADRNALHHAEARAVQARRRHAAAQHRLDTAPRWQRRTTRHDLHIAERQLDRAQDYLERTRQRAAPATERHAHAVADQRHAHDQLRNCDTIELLDAMLPSVGEQRLRVHALTTWQEWAEGHDVAIGTLRAAVAVLAHRPGLEQQPATTLCHDLGETPIERTPQHSSHLDAATARIAQPDLGIEL